MVTVTAPAPLHIECPTCGGEGICEHIGPRFGNLDRLGSSACCEEGGRVSWEEACERCDGAGVVLAAVCGDCGRVVAMGDLEDGFCWRCM